MENVAGNIDTDSKVVVFTKFSRGQIAENENMVVEAKRQVNEAKKQIEESGKLLENMKEKSFY